MLLRIDHVQLAMPPGREDEAERFYAGVLGVPRVPKPPELAKRGGCWFELGAVKLHLGVEADFRAAKKAHPALVVRDWDALMAKLAASGIAIRMSDEIPGTTRGHIDDPFGNRIELIAE